MTTCPNCNSEIKKGLFASNQMLPDSVVPFLNEFVESKKSGYCQKCLPEAVNSAIQNYDHEVKSLQAAMLDLITSIPVVNNHSPLDWSYETIGYVTGQSVMGAGIFTEIGASFSEVFGSESNMVSEKIRAGERSCLLQIKRNAVELGGNAILALDIDYNNLNGKMIMVCMTGTAVSLKTASAIDATGKLDLYKQRLSYLKGIKRAYEGYSLQQTSL